MENGVRFCKEISPQNPNGLPSHLALVATHCAKGSLRDLMNQETIQNCYNNLLKETAIVLEKMAQAAMHFYISDYANNLLYVERKFILQSTLRSLQIDEGSHMTMDDVNKRLSAMFTVIGRLGLPPQPIAKKSVFQRLYNWMST